jgi:hypothetical protein
MELLSIFPSPIGVVDFLTESQCSDILKYIKTESFDQHGALTGDSLSTYMVTNKEEPSLIKRICSNVFSCRNISHNLSEEIIKYSTRIGYRVSKECYSWVNIQNKGSLLKAHTHPNSLLSGAIYINTDKNSSRLYFHTPNPFIAFTDVESRTEYTSEYFEIQPYNGLLVIFPSWITHSSLDNVNETEERCVISFNTKF